MKKLFVLLLGLVIAAGVLPALAAINGTSLTVSNLITPPLQIYPVGTSNAAAGVTPSYSSSGTGTSLLAKATTGNLYYVRVANIVATAGTVLIVNNSTVPATGAINTARVLACMHIAASGDAEFKPTLPFVHSSGIVVLLSSAVDCVTYTTGVITGHLTAEFQ